MTSKTLVPVEEYLKMSFDGPMPEYVDGEIIERHLGSTPHFKAQDRLIEFFRSLRQSHSLYGYSEVTLRMSPTQYRVADVAVFLGGVPPSGKKYPSEPPEFAIEVVSEDDRHVEIVAKLAEYYAWGVKYVWLVDPWTKKFSVYDSAGLRDTASFELPEFGARLSRDEIFGN
jgi:Uma2 family endonuclease